VIGLGGGRGFAFVESYFPGNLVNNGGSPKDGALSTLQLAAMSTDVDNASCGHKLQPYLLRRLVFSRRQCNGRLMGSANKLFKDSRTCPLCEISLSEPDVPVSREGRG